MKSGAALLLALCLAPATLLAQKVSVDYDRSVDFSKYRTYRWEGGEAARNPLAHKRVVNAIESQLAAKGWSRSDAAASAVIIYHVAIDEQKQVNVWGNAPRFGGFATANVETIRVGQLVVDVYDASSRELIWRGVVSDTATDKPEKNEKKMNAAVARLFKEFPPASAGMRTSTR